MRPRAFPRTLSFVSARTMRPSLSFSLSIVRSSVRCVLFYPVVFIARAFSPSFRSSFVHRFSFDDELETKKRLERVKSDFVSLV